MGSEYSGVVSGVGVLGTVGASHDHEEGDPGDVALEERGLVGLGARPGE